MTRIPGLRRVFRLAVGRRGVKKDIDEEIRFHLDVRTEELIGEGYSPQEAEDVARREFGDVAKYRAQLESLGSRKVSRARRADLKEGIRQDLSFAFRQLWRNKGFSLAAALTLALGVGATTSMFSVVNGVLLRPLPFPEPDRLVAVRYQFNSTGETANSLSQPDIQDLQAESSSLRFVTGYTGTRRTLTGSGEAEIIRGARVTQGLLATFGATPALGRDLMAEEDAPDGPRVAVLSHSFWLERFSGDPNVLGQSLILSGVSFEVVGVAPEGFDFPRGAQFWVPNYTNTEECGRGCHVLEAVSRLTSSGSLETARLEASAIASRLEEAYVDSNHDRGFHLIPLAAAQVEDSRTALLVLLGSVSMVLLIACANVANLLLVRGTRRRGEMAIRSALGAGRGRVLTQLMVENGMLAAMGGGLGLLLAYFGLDALLSLAPSSLPRLDQVSVDGPVLLFTFGTVSLVAILFGLVPALRLSRSSLSNTMREGGRAQLSGAGRDRSRSIMLMAEMALSLVLLLGSGLLLRSFSRLSEVDPGFISEDVHRFTVSLPNAQYESPEEWIGFFEALEEELRRVPGVRSVGSVLGAPMGRTDINASFEQPDRPPPPPGQDPSADWHVATPGFFGTMGIPVLTGRSFQAQDRLGTQPVVVVSQRFAERYFPGEDPIGKPILPRVSFQLPEEMPRTVIGVVGDVRFDDLSNEPVPSYYVPQAQVGADFLTIMVRAQEGTFTRVVVQDILKGMDPDLPIRDMESMTAVVDRTLGPARFNLLLLGIFSTLAVVMAAVGLYGVVAYLVSQRTREIAVRMALGAASGNVVRMILSQGVRPALAGILVGLGIAFAGSRTLEALLFEVEPTDGFSYLSATVLLLMVVAVAAAWPALRASRIAPMTALNEE